MSLTRPERFPLEPGYRLDRYELLCPIAHGGMASVWLARMQGKHGFEKLVAIKTILPQYAADLRFQQMFLDEARIAAGIEHLNVAQILDLGEEEDILYLVMEWVDGESLSKLHRAVERKGMRIPLGVVLRILADTCGGLHAAHELCDRSGRPLGVVHRDVSPQNILVSSKGHAKLIDFGIAKALDRISGDTNTGLLKGKVQYMAPEQAVGKPLDRRADVWAIGAVLYYLLTGAAPYDGANQLATLHMLTSGEPPLPLPSSVPLPLVRVIQRSLVHAPEQRIGTAAEMQYALELSMMEIGVPTTTSDVAAFASVHLAERTAARRNAVELALEAAAERMRLQYVMTPPVSLTSVSGVSMRDPHSIVSASAATALNQPPGSGPSLVSAISGLSGPRSNLLVPPMLNAFEAPGSQVSLAQMSAATLGSNAALHGPLLGRRWWGFAAMGAGAAAAVALGVFTLASMLSRHPTGAVGPNRFAASPSVPASALLPPANLPGSPSSATDPRPSSTTPSASATSASPPAEASGGATANRPLPKATAPIAHSITTTPSTSAGESLASNKLQAATTTTTASKPTPSVVHSAPKPTKKVIDDGF